LFSARLWLQRLDERKHQVSGLETGAAIAGKFLAPYAAKASLALAKKGTYRWRVAREVRRRVDFEFPRRHFRAWLKSVTEDDLAKPVEIVGAQLALRLTRWFEDRDDSWRSRISRDSQALRLVEATYLAILKAADPGLGRQLREQWARHRNEDLIEAFVQLVEANSQLSSDDLAVWLCRRS
jgi:hypothetical protein